MNEIFFLVFAFFTVFLSIKLSYYADALSKSSGISNALIGGVLLAGVTSLPEFVTCFSAVFVGNPALAIGDILGSNLFNIFMICFFDVLFIKRMMFVNTSRSHNFVILLLLLNYIFIYLFISKILDFSIFIFSLPTLVIFISYIFYFRNVSVSDEDKNVGLSFDKVLVLKIVITSILMILSSVLLTVIVNNLSNLYPSFSSSFLGAIFLGVTTSLPEVITFYTLIVIKNYDLALSNILGSNLFNLLVLAICDLFVLGYPIYSFYDKDTLFIVLLGFIFILCCFISNNRKKVLFKFSYIILSFVVVFSYISFWILSFLGF